MENFELLSDLGIDPNILRQYQILCLPENIGNHSEDLDLVDSGESITLSKLLKEQSVKCANSYDIGLNTKVSERRGSDLWLGFILVFDKSVLPIFNSVVGRLLADQLSKRIKSHQESKGTEDTKVHATLKVVDGKLSAEVKYIGDADTFLKVLKGINDEQSSSAR